MIITNFNHFIFMAFGLTYKKHRFFIETSSDSIFQNEIFSADRIGNLLTFNGLLSEEKDLKEQIALNHELNHAVQDLSVPSSIVEGEFRDRIKATALVLSNVHGLRYPLCEESNRIYNKQLMTTNHEVEKNLDTFYFLYDIYETIFLKSYAKPVIPEFKINSPNEYFFDNYNLSITDLLETYAHHKSYWEQFIATPMSEERASKLHRLTKEANLYPFHVNDSGFEFESGFLKYAKPYHIVQIMLMLVNRMFDTKELVDYYENSIPNDYLSSQAFIMMRLMGCALETSLCIPSWDYIAQAVSNDFMSILSFSPVHRFYKILKLIYETDSFPELKEGEDYFITFHNWVAVQNGWLDFKTTMTTVFNSLYGRAVDGREVISNYQMTALSYKFEHLTESTAICPLEIFKRVNMPVMLKTSNNLVSLFFLGNHVKNDTGQLNFIDLYFHPVDLDGQEGIVKYQNISNEFPLEENIKRIMNNALGARREIVVRMLAYETTRALTKRGYFSCPLCEGLCPHGCEACASFSSFQNIAPHCNRNILRGHTAKILLNDNSGNSIDCMLFNYLLDYGYDPNVFE